MKILQSAPDSLKRLAERDHRGLEDGQDDGAAADEPEVLSAPLVARQRVDLFFVFYFFPYFASFYYFWIIFIPIIINIILQFFFQFI